MPKQSPTPDYDAALTQFFTDLDHLRDMFKQLTTVLTLGKRIFVLHGVGGAGKTSLLRMFRLHCKSTHIPVALASGDATKSAVGVLSRWANDLEADAIALPTFAKTFDHYRAVQAKAVGQAEKIGEKLAKGAAKTITETVLSTIPGIGPILGKLGGMSIEALIDWLRGQSFAKPDIDLLLDPTKRLTDDFLFDIEKTAPTRRIVLMLDTIEKMTTLEDWTCDLAKRLHPNLLLVVAGRGVPNWDRRWMGWLAQAQVEQIELMSPDVMRELVQRYYKTLTNSELDIVQVEGIIQFARGLPLAITSAVDLMVKYHARNFQAITPKVINDLAKRLQEDVPDDLKPALQAAAILRWFDEPTLRAVMQKSDVSGDYDELQRSPFVVLRDERFALHDVVRETLDANLRARDPERHHDWHERAAVYFEAQMTKLADEETERLALERVYHRVCADEEAGIELFQEMAEELVRYWFRSRLRNLLNDVNTYSMYRDDSRLWVEYYNAVLAHLNGERLDAEKVYQVIGENERANQKVRAYSLCNWGVLVWERRIGKKEIIDKALWCHEKSLELAPLDSQLVANLLQLARIYRDLGEWDKALKHLQQSLAFYSTLNNRYGEALTYLRLYHYYAYLGDWKNMFMAHKMGTQVQLAAENSFTRAEFLDSLGIAWVWAGRYFDIISNIQQSINMKQRLDVGPSIGDYRDMGLALAFTGRQKDSTHYIDLSLGQSNQMVGYTEREVAVTLGFLGTAFLKLGDYERAQEFLSKSVEMKLTLEDTSYLLDSLIWLGVLSEHKNVLGQSEDFYRQCLNYRRAGRRYFESAALTGLARVKQAQGDYAAITPLLAEAEELAQQYEYNDHLASLRLTQGHIAWEDKAPSWDNGYDATLHFYQYALVYSLRYNRFLLDEVLSGRSQGSPLQPLIPYCLTRGSKDGRRMLIALCDWWKAGVNDIGKSRPDTISQIPEGIPLLEAERLARQREPGDGSQQKSVVEQIDAILSN